MDSVHPTHTHREKKRETDILFKETSQNKIVLSSTFLVNTIAIFNNLNLFENRLFLIFE